MASKEELVRENQRLRDRLAEQEREADAAAERAHKQSEATEMVIDMLREAHHALLEDNRCMRDELQALHEQQEALADSWEAKLRQLAATTSTR